MTHRTSVALLLAIATLPSRAQTTPALDTISAAGRVRQYLVILPARTSSRPAPLVLFFHGRGYSAQGASARQAFDTVAAPAGAIVVYPAGIDHHWNDGRDYFNDANDVAFVRALLARL